MKTLAIITARGGSKRIPRKNIKPFLGKPIIAYSIQAALESSSIQEVMVSTDDDEIGQIAVEHGAIVPFKRSASNSRDKSTVVNVLLEVIGGYENIGKQFDYVCCIFPTAPFIDGHKLDDAFNTLIKNKFDCLFPIIRNGFSIQRAIKRNSNGKVEMFYPEFMHIMSQDLTPSYRDAGQFYWVSIEKLKEKKRIWMPNTGGVIVSELEAQDIDSLDDWILAELKYQRFKETLH